MIPHTLLKVEFFSLFFIALRQKYRCGFHRTCQFSKVRELLPDKSSVGGLSCIGYQVAIAVGGLERPPRGYEPREILISLHRVR